MFHKNEILTPRKTLKRLGSRDSLLVNQKTKEASFFKSTTRGNKSVVGVAHLLEHFGLEQCQDFLNEIEVLLKNA